MAPVLKTDEQKCSVSSNLTASAKFSLVLMAARLSPKQKVAVRVRSGMPVLRKVGRVVKATVC